MNRWQLQLDKHERILNIDQMDPNLKEITLITHDKLVIVNIQENQNPAIYNDILEIVLQVETYEFDNKSQLFIPKEWRKM